jgi:hypothetical protein
MYADEKLTDQAIVDHIGPFATLKRVRSWRKRFGIKTLVRTERHEVPAIEGRLRSLLIGSMLGDGRLDRLPNSTRYSENHTDKQRGYAEWKRLQWGPWVKSELKPVSWIQEKKIYPGWRFETVAHPSLNKWHSMFYGPEGPKLLTPGVVNLVDPFALAVWYMDDGSAEWWPLITFGMKSEDRLIAVSIFDKFGLHPRWGHVKGGTGQFFFEREDQAHLFISLVKPHIPECMQQKLIFGFQGPHYQVRQAIPESTLRELASKNVPMRRIAKELGVGASTVSRHLQRYNIPHPRKIGRPVPLS